MNRKRKPQATALNENDRKVLDKYARYSTDIIESAASDARRLENGMAKRVH